MSRPGLDSTSADLPALLAGLRDAAERRERHRLSVREIARRSGQSASYISEVFSARKHPSEQVLRAIIREALRGSVADENRALALARETPRRPRRRTARPKMLPAALPAFVGRSEQLAQISLAARRQQMVVISGMGGIGKTCLAIHWARTHARRFRRGLLYADLHGFDRERPEKPQTVVENFLAALGVDPASRAPHQLIDTYRELVGPQTLVLLDNAADADQVRALLPDAGATVLITSRDDLTEIQVREGALGIVLEPMTDAESREALIARVGLERVAEEDHAAAALVEACAGLPLALGIVGARLAGHPHERLRPIAAELGHRQSRLDVLEGLRAVISWSDRFDPATRHAMRLLSAAPPVVIDLGGAAALFNEDIRSSRRALREFERAGLVHRNSGSHYWMHEMVRLYYEEQAEDLPPDEVTAAIRRLLHYCLHMAYTGERLLSPLRPDIRIDAAARPPLPQPPADQQQAVDWFDAETAMLAVVQRVAADHGWNDEVWQLAWCMDNYLYRRGSLELHERMWRLGLAAAERTGDTTVIALGELCLGRVLTGPEAQTHLLRALKLTSADDPAHRTHRAQAHRALSLQASHRDSREALHHAVAALRLFRELNEPVWQAVQLNAIGETLAGLGHPQVARAFCLGALRVHRQYQNYAGEAATEDGLGTVEMLAGRPASARRHYRRAIDLYRQLKNESSEADTQVRLGSLLAAGLDDPEAAREHWRAALDLYQRHGRLADVARVQALLG